MLSSDLVLHFLCDGMAYVDLAQPISVYQLSKCNYCAMALSETVLGTGLGEHALTVGSRRPQGTIAKLVCIRQFHLQVCSVL